MPWGSTKLVLGFVFSQSRTKRKNLGRRWPWRISKAVATHTSAVLGESQFVRVFLGFVGFGICARVLLVEVHCFQRIQNLT